VRRNVVSRRAQILALSILLAACIVPAATFLRASHALADGTLSPLYSGPPGTQVTFSDGLGDFPANVDCSGLTIALETADAGNVPEATLPGSPDCTAQGFSATVQIPDVPPGDYVIDVSTGNYHDRSPTFTVTASGTDTPTVTPTSSTSPTGTVTATPTSTSTETTTGTATATPTSSGTATPTASSTSTGTTTATATAKASDTPKSLMPASPIASATRRPTSPVGSANNLVVPTATAPIANGATGAATTAMFAEGYTGQATTNKKATFTETLNVLNPTSSALTVTFTYYVEAKQRTRVVVARTVAADSVLCESVNADVGPDQLVAAVVTAPGRVAVTRSITRVSLSGARLDGSTTQGVDAPSKIWYFAEGYTGSTFQEYLTLLNPTGSKATAMISLAPQADSAAAAPIRKQSIPAFGRVTVDVRSLNRGKGTPSVGMIVVSDAPIVAERVEYFGDGAGSGKFGSIVSQGISAASSLAHFAFGASGGSATDSRDVMQPVGNQDYITVLNPGIQPGAIQVVAHFADAAGDDVGQPVQLSLAAGTRKTIQANAALGTSAYSSFSVTLTGTNPFVAESSEYFGGSPNAGRHPGVAFAGQATCPDDVLLPDVSLSLADGSSLNRTVYVYNASAGVLHLQVQYYGASGPVSRAAYTVPAGGITLIDVNQDLAGLTSPGSLGAEIQALPGSTGQFLAVSLGTTTDGLSVTEESGMP